jgi:transcriptional regulator with XRE-family HTH domain
VNADEKIFLEKLGKNITRLRMEQQLTKVQLAFEINTGESAIRRIELGQINSGALILKKIAIALNVSVCDLFNFD